MLNVALDALPDQTAHHAARSPLLATPRVSAWEAEGWIIRKGHALMNTDKTSMPQTRQPDDNLSNAAQLPLPGMPGKVIDVVKPYPLKTSGRDESIIIRCPYCSVSHRHIGAAGVRKAKCNGRNYLLCPGTADCVEILARSLANKAQRVGGEA